jgi:hypothetical protein
VIEELKIAKHEEILITAHSLYLVVLKNNELDMWHGCLQREHDGQGAQ